MNKFELEKLRQARNYARRKILIKAGFRTGTDAEIYETLQSGLKKLWERVKIQGYTLEEFADCIREIEKFN